MSGISVAGPCYPGLCITFTLCAIHSRGHDHRRGNCTVDDHSDVHDWGMLVDELQGRWRSLKADRDYLAEKNDEKDRVIRMLEDQLGQFRRKDGTGGPT